LATCSIEVWPRFCSIWPLTAVMAIGVCCTFCARNWAVTTTSPTVVPALADALAGADSGALAPTPPEGWAAPPPASCAAAAVANRASAEALASQSAVRPNLETG
jgi:hypothetical protein